MRHCRHRRQKRDGKWSCPPKKTRRDRPTHQTENQGTFSAAGETKWTCWEAPKPLPLPLLFAVLFTSVSSAGNSGDNSGHVQQVKCLIYSTHFSDVQALKRRNLLLRALNFSREQTKNIKQILRTDFSNLLFSTALLVQCSWNQVLHKQKAIKQRKPYHLLYDFFRSSAVWFLLFSKLKLP